MRNTPMAEVTTAATRQFRSHGEDRSGIGMDHMVEINELGGEQV